MKIGDRTLEGIERQVDALLKDYLEDIDAAYCRCENDLTISFSVDEQQIGLPFPETDK